MPRPSSRFSTVNSWDPLSCWSTAFRGVDAARCQLAPSPELWLARSGLGVWISIRGHHSWQSTSVVFLISCTSSAVWRSLHRRRTLREWMNGHRSSIKNNEDTPVAVHFTHRDHSWQGHSSGEGANWHRCSVDSSKSCGSTGWEGPSCTVLNRDDDLVHPSAVNSMWFCLFLYFLCQFLHFPFSPCACVNPISSFLLLPLLLVLPYLAPVALSLGAGM